MRHCFHRLLVTIGLLLALGVLAFQPFADAQVGASEKGNVLFILDGSGSMWAEIDNKPKIVIAKEVMINLIQQLPDTVKAGLEVYGHRSKGDCNDIELLSLVGKSDKTTLVQQIQSIQPKGKTPITGSLKLAAEQLRAAEEETAVVLISDGKETCQGDPCVLVSQLRKQGIKVKVHVVGFDVNQAEREQLMCIADAGGGKYFTAQNAGELTNALTEVRKEVIASVEAKPKEPETKTKQKVIKISRPSIKIGTIEIKNTQDFVTILDQQTGKKKGFRGSTDRPIQVPVGTYKLKFPNFVVEGIEVGPGEKKRIDASTLVGWISIPNTRDFVTILDQQTGKKKGFRGSTDRPIQVPVGTYQLKFPNFTVDDIVVQAGQKVVVELD